MSSRSEEQGGQNLSTCPSEGGQKPTCNTLCGPSSQAAAIFRNAIQGSPLSFLTPPGNSPAPGEVRRCWSLAGAQQPPPCPHRLLPSSAGLCYVPQTHQAPSTLKSSQKLFVLFFRKLSPDLSEAGHFLWFRSHRNVTAAGGHSDHQIKIRHPVLPRCTAYCSCPVAPITVGPWLLICVVSVFHPAPTPTRNMSSGRAGTRPSGSFLNP